MYLSPLFVTFLKQPTFGKIIMQLPPEIIGLLAGHSHSMHQKVPDMIVPAVENQHELLPILRRAKLLGRVLDPVIKHALAFLRIYREILIR